MNDSVQTLHAGAVALSEASRQARGWVKRLAQSASSVANEEHSLLQEGLRAENLARKFAAAAARPNSAGVFGPSQAGKSYLVSVLGRSSEGPLIANFAGDRKNFLMEINPGGDRESTGLVTRFTIAPGTTDNRYPVELRMLTETDLVRILGNSFLSDFDPHSRKLNLPSEAEVRKLITRLEPLATQPQAHLDEVAMFDVGEYFHRYFERSVGVLSNVGYWDALVRFGHRLPPAARVELFSVLWGLSPDLSAVFELLQKALTQLGHPVTARAALGALVPRNNSIIDVEIVKHRLGTPQDQADTVAVVAERADGSAGPEVAIARATLCTLVAELKVVMEHKPWPFFEHTDLLDFPGARARETSAVDLPTEPEKRTLAVRNMFLRGKIAYLFQRYTEERELTCMLLCMPPSNQEVKDLTGLVAEWVGQTHGETAEARKALPCALFFVLTKFDLQLQTKPGDTEEFWRDNIEIRLDASMYQLYGSSDWLKDWDGKPFRNTFGLRNPEFRLDNVFRYESDAKNARESGIAAVAEQPLAIKRAGMLASERCQRHFADPAKSWDACLALNDGGVRHLVDQMQTALQPGLKVRQLAGRLREQSERLDARLRRYYLADDDATRREREQALSKQRGELFAATREQGFRGFYHLLDAWMVRHEALREAFLNVIAMVKVESPDDAAAAPAPADDFDPWMDDVPDVAASQPAAQDRPAEFASRALNLWTERVRALASDERRLRALGVNGRLVEDFANELVVAAHRQGLVDSIARRIREQMAAANVQWDEVVDRCATIALMEINDFVAYLGYAGMAEADRPAVPEAPKPRQRSVFPAGSLLRTGEFPVLGRERTVQEREFFLDWGIAYRQIGVGNISFAGGREIGEADNRELGEILGGLAPARNLDGLE